MAAPCAPSRQLATSSDVSRIGYSLADLRHICRDFRARIRLQQGHGRFDAYLLSRPSASCPITPSSAARPILPWAWRFSNALIGRNGIVIANIGDSSVASGPVWEALNFAVDGSVSSTLWEADLGGAPPILFSFVNNFYGMGGQPQGETLGMGQLARVGLGVNADAMHSERVDGYNPLAVADATRRAEDAAACKGAVRRCWM